MDNVKEIEMSITQLSKGWNVKIMRKIGTASFFSQSTF